MRLNGEIHGENGEDEEEQSYHPQKLVVGYALTSKKKKSFLQPKLLALARYAIYIYMYIYIFIYIHVHISAVS